MRVAFLASDKARERLLADAFLKGAKRHGHETQVIPLTEGEPEVGNYDVACFVGVKSRELFQAHGRAGIPVLYFDKGYSRHSRTDGVRGWEYWRVAINAHQPTERLDRNMPGDRAARFGWESKPWRKRGSTIILAGSSGKYHDFYGIRNPTHYWARKVEDIRDVSDLEIVYRPKPSWREAVPIEGTRYSELPERLEALLAKAHVLVTHGSNCCFEAAMAGIPSIVLGEAVAKPISSTSLDDIVKPRLANDEERGQWLANLAWWQWNSREFYSGEAWEFLGEQIHG